MRRTAGIVLTRLRHLGGLAREVSKLRRGDSIGATRARAHVADRLGTLRGLPQKVGQMFAYTGEAADARPFHALCETPTAVETPRLRATLTRELGAPVDSVFSWIDERGVAASLSQVVRARLRDGRDVAIKVQYPDVAAAVRADLRALGWFSSFGGSRGFDLSAYRKEIVDTFDAELDYRVEARTLRRFHERAERLPGLQVPAPHDAFSSPRVLVMDWLDGAPIATASTWPAAARATVATTLLEFTLRGWLWWGEYHADPHPGNLRVHRRGTEIGLGVLDFGCVKSLTPEARAGLRVLLHPNAATSTAPDSLLDAFVAVGFARPAMTRMAGRLPRIQAALLSPFVGGETLADALGDHRVAFRQAGAPGVLFLIRTLHGLSQHLRQLDVHVPYPDVYRAVAGAAPAEIVATPPTQEPSMPLSAATHLCVTVQRDGVTRAALTFPAAAAAHLADLVPTEAGAALETRRIDLPSIARRLVTEGFPIGPVFTLDDGGLVVRVWLE